MIVKLDSNWLKWFNSPESNENGRKIEHLENDELPMSGPWPHRTFFVFLPPTNTETRYIQTIVHPAACGRLLSPTTWKLCEVRAEPGNLEEKDGGNKEIGIRQLTSPRRRSNDLAEAERFSQRIFALQQLISSRLIFSNTGSNCDVYMQGIVPF